MSVRRKLTFIILLVALAPLALSAYSSLRVHQGSYDAKVTELRESAAERGATVTNLLLGATRANIRALVADTIHWPVLSSEERDGAQWLVYQQSDDIAVVALFDDEGKGVGASSYRGAQSDPGISAHPLVQEAGLQNFAQSLPFREAQTSKSAVGAASEPAPGQAPLVSLAFSTPGLAPNAPWVVAVYLSLRGPCEALKKSAPKDATISLVDSEGKLLCGEQPENDGDHFVASVTTDYGWTVSVHEPRATVIAPSRRILYQMLFWVVVGLIAALAAGLVLARGINGPIAVLTSGAKALESGDLEHRIPPLGEDEFGHLSQSFNSMADQIADWSQTLRDRVEERTRDLKETQEMLVESKKQAALATMGAGIAHEINNPLTGVLSMVQIASNRAKKVEGQEKVVKMLGKAEDEARRIRDIVQRMQALSQQEQGIREDLALSDLVSKSLESLKDELVAADVSVSNEIPDDIPHVFGNAAELRQATHELIKNAIRAMVDTKDRRLTITAEQAGEDLVSLDVVDTGCGVANEDLGKVFEPFFTAKADWDSKGLGLSVVKRIITDHQGTIRMNSTTGNGATVHVVLPTATRRAHLE